MLNQTATTTNFISRHVYPNELSGYHNELWIFVFYKITIKTAHIYRFFAIYNYITVTCYHMFNVQMYSQIDLFLIWMQYM